jgi:hypothetical protein
VECARIVEQQMFVQVADFGAVSRPFFDCGHGDNFRQIERTSMGFATRGLGARKECDDKNRGLWAVLAILGRRRQGLGGRLLGQP